jgi:hypothetical protein
MDLRGYYQKIREIEAKIDGVFAVIVSLESADGGKAGTQTEVTRALAAKMVAEGQARLATPAEKRAFEGKRAATPEANT